MNDELWLPQSLKALRKSNSAMFHESTEVNTHENARTVYTFPSFNTVWATTGDISDVITHQHILSSMHLIFQVPSDKLFPLFSPFSFNVTISRVLKLPEARCKQGVLAELTNARGSCFASIKHDRFLSREVKFSGWENSQDRTQRGGGEGGGNCPPP